MGTWVDPDQELLTFCEFSNQWRTGKNSVSGKTLATYDSQLRLHILPHFENFSLTGITTAEVRNWVSKLSSEDVGPTTIRQSYRLFRQMMESAYIDERISRNPCAGIQLPKIATSDKRGLTREELNSLAIACGDYAALIMFLGTTGLRIGEALALKIEDFDLLTNKIHVRRSWTIDVRGAKVRGKTKTGVSRKVPVSPEVLSSLSPFLESKGYDDWVFLGPKGNMLDHDWFRKSVFVPAADSLGLDGITIHSLRHTCAWLLIKLKAPITTVSHILGHASVEMTLDTYGHYYEDDTAEWINHLGQFVSTSGTK
jgi:integrase